MNLKTIQVEGLELNICVVYKRFHISCRRFESNSVQGHTFSLFCTQTCRHRELTVTINSMDPYELYKNVFIILYFESKNEWWWQWSCNCGTRQQAVQQVMALTTDICEASLKCDR